MPISLQICSIAFFGVQAALFKISELYDLNPWRNNLSKLATYDSILQRPHSALQCIVANKLVELLVTQNEDDADNKGSENTRRLHSYLIFATTATTSSGVHFFKDSAFLLH